MAISESSTVGLYVAEESELYREVYRTIFPSGGTIKLLGISSTQNLKELLNALSRFHPDVLLLGIKKLNTAMVKELREIRDKFPNLGIIIMLMTDNAENINMLKDLTARAGSGMAVFLKHSLERVDQFYRIISSVKEGHVILDPALTGLLFNEKQGPQYLKEFTPRELELLNLLAKGYSNSAIAEALFIDIRTVQHHINNMYSKIKADSDYKNKHLRVSAARLYLETSGELLTAGASR